MDFAAACAAVLRDRDCHHPREPGGNEHRIKRAGHANAPPKPNRLTPRQGVRAIQPQQSKTKRVTDTSPFVGHDCRICGKRVHVSKGNGYWRVNPKTRQVTAYHTKCAVEAAF